VWCKHRTDPWGHDSQRYALAPHRHETAGQGGWLKTKQDAVEELRRTGRRDRPAGAQRLHRHFAMLEMTGRNWGWPPRPRPAPSGRDRNIGPGGLRQDLPFFVSPQFIRIGANLRVLGWLHR